VLDRAGRLQIPRELLDQLGIEDNKVKLEYNDGKIIIQKPERRN
jgi:bifunctional DNA-binding transcriptional regulator/antitoxin component of YhaV-PrlF toxin-antitoxin module